MIQFDPPPQKKKLPSNISEWAEGELRGKKAFVKLEIWGGDRYKQWSHAGLETSEQGLRPCSELWDKLQFTGGLSSPQDELLCCPKLFTFPLGLSYLCYLFLESEILVWAIIEIAQVDYNTNSSVSDFNIYADVLVWHCIRWVIKPFWAAQKFILGAAQAPCVYPPPII